MAGTSIRLLVLSTAAGLALAGCQPGAGPFAAKPVAGETGGGETGAVASATSVKLVDRDVEAPDVFQIMDEALWDGRPSLGGVWVASPDAVDPERVILRNPANGKFVIGALFRRERDNPGPKLQISSDAAAALGLLAGQPGKISVTALRREEAPAATDASKPILDASETIETAPLDTAAIAAGAIDKAQAKAADGPAVPTAPTVAATPAPQSPAPAAAGGGVIQIGIFSVEANARRAVDTLTAAGIAVVSHKEESQGKAFWSVTARGDAAVLAKIKSAGFADAYFLKRG